MMAHEEDINIRREKLRLMLERDEAELMREIVNLIHSTENSRKEEIRIRSEEKRILEEENRRFLVTNKKRQQHLENCPETRERMSRDIVRDVKYSNLMQMLEKEIKKTEERRLDDLWYQIMMKENELKRMKEEEEMKKRVIAGRETGLILKQQIAGRSSNGQVQRLREEERLELERLWNEVRGEEVRNLANEREKRERLRRDLEEQLLSTKRRMLDEAGHEAEVERILKVTNENELKDEKEKIAKSAEYLKNEMISYMKSLEDLRSEERRRDAEVNAIIEESAKDTQARRDLASKRYKEERKRILDKIMSEREEQLRLKLVAERNQKKQIEEEKNLLKKNAEVEAISCKADAMRKRKMALFYGEELQAQRRYDEDKKCREIEKDRELHLNSLKENDEYQKLTEMFVNSPEIIAPSAFKIKVKEYMKLRDEQKGLCGSSVTELQC